MRHLGAHGQLGMKDFILILSRRRHILRVLFEKFVFNQFNVMVVSKNLVFMCTEICLSYGEARFVASLASDVADRHMINVAALSSMVDCKGCVRCKKKSIHIHRHSKLLIMSDCRCRRGFQLLTTHEP